MLKLDMPTNELSYRLIDKTNNRRSDDLGRHPNKSVQGSQSTRIGGGNAQKRGIDSRNEARKAKSKQNQ